MRLPLPLLAILLLLTASLRAQVLDPAFAPPTSVYKPSSVSGFGPVLPTGERLVYGQFTRVNGTALSALARLTNAGVLDTAFHRRLGTTLPTTALIQGLPGSKYLVQQNTGTVQAGGLTRTQLLRLNTDGSGDASFNAGTGATKAGVPVAFTCLVQTDGKLLLLGTFDAFNGQPAAGIIRLNTDGTRDTSYVFGSSGLTISNTPSSSTVALQSDNKLLLVGYFPAANSLPATQLVRLNTDGSRDLTYSSPYPISMIVVGLTLDASDRALVLGCTYNFAPAPTVPELVRLLPTGALDPSFTADASLFSSTPTTSANVWQIMVQPDGKLLLNNGSPDTGVRVARLLPTGQVDPAFQPLTGDYGTYTFAALQPDGTIWVGGYSAGFANTESPLGRLSSTGAVDATFAPRLLEPGTVADVVRQPDGRLLVGGNFVEYNGQAVHRLVRLSAAGVLETSFVNAVAPLPGSVSHLALLPGGALLVGTAHGLVSLTATGSLNPAFAPPTLLTTATITTLAIQANGQLLVGGYFTGTQNGVPYRSVVRLSSTGALDLPFSQGLATGPSLPPLPELVLEQANGQVLVAGLYPGATPNYVMRLQRYAANGTPDATFSSPAFLPTNLSLVYISHINTLVQQPDGKLLVGGDFSATGATPAYGLVRLTTTGSLDPTFGTNALAQSTIVSALVLQPNGRLLIGCSTIDRQNAATIGIKRLLTDGTLDASFQLATSPYLVTMPGNSVISSVVSLLLEPDGAIVAGGRFTTVNGQPALNLARLTGANVLAVAAPATTAALTQAWPVPAHGLLHVAPDMAAQPQAATLLDALGRPVRAQVVGSAPEFTIPVAGLPAGVYLLRVQYAAGATTRRVVIE